MTNNLAAFLDALDREQSFERVAQVTLQAMLDSTRRALSDSPLAPKATIDRVLVHMRSDAGYRGLMMLDGGDGSFTAVLDNPDLLPSANAWRLVSETGRPVRVDVAFRELKAEGCEPVTVKGWSLDELANPDDAPRDSRDRLLARGATHIYAVPWRSTQGRLVGMIVVEACCRQAMGQPFIWEACGGELELIARVAGPHLATAPPAPMPHQHTDAHLPVVGQAMSQRVLLARLFAQQRDVLLLSGETGTGKTRMARWCHERSHRASGPFVPIDLLSLPPSLRMAHVTGWGKGSFTGAFGKQVGAIAEAEGGTLFLDEIDKLDDEQQTALLRIVEESAYRPIGQRERKADVRFIFATNADLRQLVEDGRFSKDLFYRIHVLSLEMPPLRERRDEIAAWSEFLLTEHHAYNEGTGSVLLSHQAAQLLRDQPWPGNLRQLKNVVKRAYTHALLVGGVAGGGMILGEPQVREALASEGRRSPGPAVEAAAEQLATEWVRLAVQAHRRGETFDMDLLEGVKGYILEMAERDMGNVEAALVALGRDNAVRNRNIQKLLRGKSQAKKELLDRLNRHS